MANTYTSKFLSSPATLEGYDTTLIKPYVVSDTGFGGYPFTLTSINDTLYFFTSFDLDPPEDPYDNGDYVGLRLWKSDGTKAGTVVVKDIFPIFYKDAEPYALTNVNGVLYFIPDYSKLWKSDGTAKGTEEVFNFQGYRNDVPHLLANINGFLYFSVINNDSISDSRYDLWKSDGTKEGTFRLKEFYPGDSFAGIRELTNINDTLYFVAGSSYAPPALWKSDGTTAGTVPFKQFTTEDEPKYLTTVKNIFYFTTGYKGELWKSDGTEAGTVLVKDINSSYLRNFNDTLYFLSDPNPSDGINGDELWKTDGTATGTVLVKDINPGPSGSFALYSNDFITEVNGTLYFYADDGTHGQELWKSDGTEAGTVLVKDINPGSDSSIVSNGNSVQNPLLTDVNGTLYFYADDGIHGGELWKSDGTAEGTVLVEDIKPGAGSSDIFDLTNVDGTLYFNADDGIHGKELWALNTNPPVASPTVSITALDANAAEAGNNPAVFRISRTGDTSKALTVKYNIDGTATNGQDYNQLNGSITIAAGQSFVDLDITPLADTFPEDSETVTVTLFDKYYQYYLVDPSNNATTATIADDPSTVVLTQPYLVKDIHLGPSGSDISNLTKVNDTLFFTKLDGRGSDYELWKSNGTSGGTVFIKDISQNSFADPTNINSILYFIDYQNDHQNVTLWKSDGTQNGTSAVKNYTSSNGSYVYIDLTKVNDSAYFSVNYINYSDLNSSKYELWKSDGTTTDTVKVKDIRASNLINLNGTLYFTSFDKTNGNALWKSNGTAEGTVVVKKITSSSDTSNIRNTLINVNGTLFFDVYDRSGKNNGLWKSDGTAAGTVFVKNIIPDSNPNTSDISSFNNATNVNGTLFFTAYNNTYGNELWKSDGTTKGTVIVKDLNPGLSYDTFSNWTNVNGILYFTIDDRLWKSDGTEDGTVLVKDINPKSGSFDYENLFELTNANGTLYFSADDGINGRELWKSDGTEAGTVLVKDLNSGDADSNPTNLTFLNDTLYFTANDGIYGNELWAIKTDNVINGSGSRDPLTGTAGSDRIIGGTGSKTITGGAGNDDFVYTSIKEVGQRITDFTVGEDKIVLTQLLDSLVSGGYNGSDAIADGYVRLVKGNTANSTILQIDRDGAIGNAVFRNFIELDNVTPQAMNNLSNFVF